VEKYYKNSFGLGFVKVVKSLHQSCCTMQETENSHYYIHDCQPTLICKDFVAGIIQRRTTAKHILLHLDNLGAFYYLRISKAVKE
jgi:hypothetical protein